MESTDQVSIRAIRPKEIKSIDIKSISSGNRSRQDLGDIDSLKDSITQNGLFHPVVVKESIDNEGYFLMAGYRRLSACKSIGWKNIPANIYPADLTQLERQIVELCENIDRKDMTYDEEVAVKSQIHMAMQELHGKAEGGGADRRGHSLRDTAKMLGQAPSTVSQDIKLAMALEKIPELKKAKNKLEAMKMLKAMEKQYEAGIIAERIESDRKTTPTERIQNAIIKSYITGDFFELSKNVDSNTMDLIEVDTPFGINLNALREGKNASGKLSTMDYNEWDQDGFLEKINKVISECYRVMKTDGWLIWWFAYEPWFEPTYQAIVDAGFHLRRAPAIWTKGRGATSAPLFRLPSTHEPFFYARKGSAQIYSPRGANDFRYKPIDPSVRRHPTEKPIELEENIYRTFVQSGSRIWIPFVGSGNGILAANNYGCSAFGYDISKVYRDVFIIKVNEGVPPNYRSYR